MIITHRQGIAAPARDVWALISTPGHLVECHPFCAENPVERWPGVGSRDTIRYHGGREVTREFLGWEDGRAFDIDVTDANGPVASVSWRLVDEGGGSALTIAITPRMLGRIPVALRWMPEWALVRPMLTSYLRAVLTGVEWRVTTGKPVQPDQFGAHRWFSA